MTLTVLVSGKTAMGAAIVIEVSARGEVRLKK